MDDLEANTTPQPANNLVKISALELDQKQHDASDIDLLYRIYADKRINAQVNFYQSRIKENEKNADFTFALGALVMTISSLIATISATVRHPVWTPLLTVLSAILPAFAALLASFRQLYGWERQTNIYRDALLGLERVRLLAPDDDRVAAADLGLIYPELVKRSESVFNGEVSQWGQFVVEKDKASQSDTVIQQYFNDLNLSDDQRAAIQTILSAGQSSNVNISANTFKASDVTLETQLPAGTGSPSGGTVTTTIHSQSSTTTNTNEEGQPVMDSSSFTEFHTEAAPPPESTETPDDGDGETSVG
jgi:hypothetical protein